MEYRAADVVRDYVLVNGVRVDALSAMVHREAAQREGTGRLQAALADLKAGIQGSSVPPGVQQALAEIERILADFPQPA